MKKIWLLLLVFSFLLSACVSGGDTSAPPPETPAPTQTPAPTPVDFSGTDFSGRWRVSDVIDSNGTPAGDAMKRELGAGFTLELLSGGTYFVYDEDGQALGQGTYAVAQNELRLTAGDAGTVYEIVDADTLRATSSDGSVTVMKRDL